MRRISLNLLLVIALLLGAVTPAFAQGDPTARGTDKTETTGNAYIVQMSEAPVVAYRGGLPGLRATAPRKGQKINPNSPEVLAYMSYLRGRHDQVLASVGAQGKKFYSYGIVFNGFAARLSKAEAAAISAQPGVVAVTKDTLRQVDTASTPELLGLVGSGGTNGLWADPAFKGRPGEGVVVGIVDSGIWPENPSFSDRTGSNPNGNDGKLSFQQIPGWHGRCVPGEQWTGTTCNQKVIGAQWFGEGWGGAAGIKADFPYEFVSARDADGHGSHTASTAAGNWGVTTEIPGVTSFTISGMAPFARISAYKVCWGRGGEGGCFNSDSVAAIDQAVADGVDVINFSISGTTANFLDPVEVAFLFAADAGVFVAASAGNSGPTASTVAHPSPWITTVAASTHQRSGTAVLTLGNGASYTGASLGGGLEPARPLILSEVAGLAGADQTEVNLCYLGTLDPAKVAGKVVVCDRGVIARVEKSQAVKEAGGVGMVLVNVDPSSINADVHFVPTVHLDSNVRDAIRAYAMTAGATASMSPGVISNNALAPTMASFSSRGPSNGSVDFLKPDITAPGVDVLAAVSPEGYGTLWNFISGTSMSSPHMAGLAALMKHKFPGWSPMMIKSAFMTTAYQTTRYGTPNLVFGTPFTFGAGHVDPPKATDPGLVYNSSWNDWLAFLCATRSLTSGTCSVLASRGYSMDPSDFNAPAIQIGDLVGNQVVTRKVTNVGNAPATYTSTAVAPAGFSATVSPATLTLAAGQTKAFSVTFSYTGATVNQYGFGSLTWNEQGGTRAARIPIVLRATPVAAPAEVFGSGQTGSLAYDARFSTPGALNLDVHGLTPAVETAGTVVDDPTDTFVVDGPGTISYTVSIPAGVTLARFSLFDQFTDGEDDLDLYVYRGTTLVGASGGGTSHEQVSLTNPPAADYVVYVHGWQTDGPDASFTLFSWLVSGEAGNATATAPDVPSVGALVPVSVNWNTLDAGKLYLGWVNYNLAGALRTVVNVTTKDSTVWPSSVEETVTEGSYWADLAPGELFLPYVQK